MNYLNQSQNFQGIQNYEDYNYYNTFQEYNQIDNDTYFFQNIHNVSNMEDPNLQAYEPEKQINSIENQFNQDERYEEDNNILAKDNMTKCLLDKNIPPITLFNKYTEIIKNDFDKLKMEYENIYLKYGSLKDEIIKNDISIEATISQKKNEEFILDNLIIEKNNIINLLKKSINLSKEFHLVREKIRDNLVDTKKIKRNIEILECNEYYEK